MCNDSEDDLALFVRNRGLEIGKRANGGKKNVIRVGSKKKGQKNRDTFSMYACHPCAGTMLIFSVSFQFFQMTSEEVPNSYLDADYLRQTIMPKIIVMGLPESSSVSWFRGK